MLTAVADARNEHKLFSAPSKFIHQPQDPFPYFKKFLSRFSHRIVRQ